MKKTLIALALVVGAVAGLYAAVASSVKITNAVGVSVISNKQAVLNSVVVGDLAGGAVTVKVFDSATGLTTNAALLRYTFNLPAAVTQTAWSREIPLGGKFLSGITVSTDGQTNTLTASWHYLPFN